jgi:GH24 family phage-related lysozyme (muramidase)
MFGARSEFDALTSLAFNIGTTRFERSSIPGLLDAGHGSEALGVWADYDHVNGTVSQGLSNRRAAEINMFNGQEPGE